MHSTQQTSIKLLIEFLKVDTARMKMTVFIVIEKTKTNIAMYVPEQYFTLVAGHKSHPKHHIK